MRFVLIALLAANLALLAWFQGWMAPYGGDGREPHRLARQIGADRIRVMTVDETRKAAQSTDAVAPTPTAGSTEAAPQPAGAPEPAARAPEPVRRPRQATPVKEPNN